MKRGIFRVGSVITVNIHAYGKSDVEERMITKNDHEDHVVFDNASLTGLIVFGKGPTPG